MKFYNPFRILKSGIYTVKGLYFILKSKHQEALSYFQKSLKYAQENPNVIYQCTKYLGITYWRDKQFQKGKEYLLEAEKMNNVNPKKTMDSELFFFLGLVYDAEAVQDTKANLQKAKGYYQLAIKHYKRMDDCADIDFISDRLIKIDEWFRKSGDVPT